MMNEYINGGLLQPTSTPVPPTSQSINGDATIDRPPAAKTVRWTGSEKEIIEIQKASLAIGLNNRTPKVNGYSTGKLGDATGVKFISLASPLGSGNDQSVRATEGRLGGYKNIVLQSRLPMRATLHRQKQIPGRFFPSPSYTEFQRDVLESRPTPRRIIKKFKPKNGADSSQLFPVGSPVKPQTPSDKSVDATNLAFSRSLQGPSSSDRKVVLPHEVDGNLNVVRQYSIPATTLFHDGNNDTLITGSIKVLHSKDSFLVADAAPHNRTLPIPR